MRTGSVASSRETSLSRRGTSQERESSEDKISHELKSETKKHDETRIDEKEQGKVDSVAAKTGMYC